MQRDAQEKMEKAADELSVFGKELRYTQQVVAGELASWQESRVEWGRSTLREFAKKMVVSEKARLESMKRAVRELGIGKAKVETQDIPAPSLEVPEEIVRRGGIEDVTDEADGELLAEDPRGLANGDVDAGEDEPLLLATDESPEELLSEVLQDEEER
jgi:hypothetical protein